MTLPGTMLTSVLAPVLALALSPTPDTREDPGREGAGSGRDRIPKLDPFPAGAYVGLSPAGFSLMFPGPAYAIGARAGYLIGKRSRFRLAVGAAYEQVMSSGVDSPSFDFQIYPLELRIGGAGRRVFGYGSASGGVVLRRDSWAPHEILPLGAFEVGGGIEIALWRRLTLGFDVDLSSYLIPYPFPVEVTLSTSIGWNFGHRR